jgi:hypothetical protein
MNLSNVQSPGRAPSTDLSLAHGTMPQSPEALIKPLLSGCSFLAGHGYQRRGVEISLSCRFPSNNRHSAMTLEVYPEGGRAFDLEGLSFRIEFEGGRAPARMASLNREGIARIEGVDRNSRVTLSLRPKR